jgi:hypothetical protein
LKLTFGYPPPADKKKVRLTDVVVRVAE